MRRDADRLGLPRPGQSEVEALLVESARTAFGMGDGIVRIEWSRSGDDAPELLTIPRAIGPEPDCWLAAVSNVTHPGPERRRNTKHVDVTAYDVAREEVQKLGLDEVLLFDTDGLLVEGSRSNFLVVTEADRLVTPDPALGAVEGLGLTIVLENHPTIVFAKLTRDDVARALELLSINVVRGVVPIVRLGDCPVAQGEPGPWAIRLRHLFTSD